MNPPPNQIKNCLILTEGFEQDPWAGSGNNSQSGTYGNLEVSSEIIFMIANNGLTGHEIHSWSPSSIGNGWLILD